MDYATYVLMVVLMLVLTAELINGWTDAPNAIATVVVTGALPVGLAIPFAVMLNIGGAMCGTAVASTIGKGIVSSDAVTTVTLGAAMLSVIVWGSLAAHQGWPVSKSHALLSGIAGAGLAGGGFDALLWGGWGKVAIGLVASVAVGYAISYVFGSVLLELCVRVNPRPAKRVFDWAHRISAGTMAFAHGMNDGQKFIGIFALVLSQHSHDAFSIPWWVVGLCSTTMGLGTALGGWRIVEKVGKKMGTIESWQGFAATSAASTVILVASHFGVPLSTTHTITSSIAGANSARGMRRVKWGVFGEVCRGWLLTFPVCTLIAFCTAKIAAQLF